MMVELSSISYILSIFMILSIVFLLTYVYVNEYEKHESLRLSEEENLLKTFQEKEIFRWQQTGEKNITKRRSIYINK
jgi:hypothetical protein